VVVVGALRSSSESLLVEEIILRLGAAAFCDILSGLRQSSCCVQTADLLLYSPLLAGDLVRPDVILFVGGSVTSMRIAAFVKQASCKLQVRLTDMPIRADADWGVSHHIHTSLEAFAIALLHSGLEPASGPPPLWQSLSDAADDELNRELASVQLLTEPYVAHTISKLICPHGQLFSSSSMPIRDLDQFAVSHLNNGVPPAANRGAAGIDGVLSSAIGFCRGSGVPTTLLIGDTATLHDVNAFQQLLQSDIPSFTMVIVNNGGGAIFSFLPIAKHKDVFVNNFDAPHCTNFQHVCESFGVHYVCCTTAEELNTAYSSSQRRGAEGPSVIEAKISVSHEENVALHRKIGQKVASRVREELLGHVNLSWTRSTQGNKGTLPMVLLHGWLGDKNDWKDVSRQLVHEGHDVLAIDLPGHGSSQIGRSGDSWEASILFNLPIVVEAVMYIVTQLQIERFTLVGYSLGGRLAMAISAAYAQTVAGTLVFCANPGMNAAATGDRYRRLRDDKSMADELAKMTHDDFQSFLLRWYAQPLWTSIADRCPEVYKRMMSKRVRCNPQAVGHALIGFSLACQPDLWSKLGVDSPFWYASGELDSKFTAVGKKVQELDASGSRTIRVTTIPTVGKAVIEESAGDAARICQEFMQHLRMEHPNDFRIQHEAPDGFDILDAWLQPIEVQLTAPLLLSRGGPMPYRQGVLVLLQAARSDSGHITGVGEVCPLPLFHQESLEDATLQLEAIVASWKKKAPCVSMSIAKMDGSMGRWLQDNCALKCPLLPSVQSGLEMALLHLIGRKSAAPHLGAAIAESHKVSYQADVGINALLTRAEDLSGSANGATIVKVKVGKDPFDDAHHTNNIAEVLQSRVGVAARLRLDANQAWTIEEATSFIMELSDRAVSITEYLEEPVKLTEDQNNAEWGANLVQAWTELASRTDKRIRFAADESLCQAGVKPQEHLVNCRAPVAALVLKPALQGLEQTIEYSRWALAHGARPVLSSMFESGVALSHYTILAASTVPEPWDNDCGVSTCHGLGTYNRLAEDILQPPFSDLVYYRKSSGWRVDLLHCQAALDHTADALASQRVPTLKQQTV